MTLFYLNVSWKKTGSKDFTSGRTKKYKLNMQAWSNNYLGRFQKDIIVFKCHKRKKT